MTISVKVIQNAVNGIRSLVKKIKIPVNWIQNLVNQKYLQPISENKESRHRYKEFIKKIKIKRVKSSIWFRFT